MRFLSKLKFVSKQQVCKKQQLASPTREGQTTTAPGGSFLWLRQLASNSLKDKAKETQLLPSFPYWIPGFIHPCLSEAKSGMGSKTAVMLMIGLLGMVYQATQNPSTQTEESTDNRLCDSARIRLADGRYLAYVEKGVPKEKSKYKIIIVHGFGSSKEMNFLAPQEMIEELGIYILQFDRAGYGESDTNPRRTVKSEALDIEELADQLQLGSKFFVIGVSMGSYPIWSCLKYIPHRLAGAALIVPVVNYRWPSLPKHLIRDDWRRKLVELSLWFSRYAPGLMHWWVTQQWLPSSSVLERNAVFFNPNDIEILKKISGFPMLSQDKLQERDVFDTLRFDFLVGFGDWDFDPTNLANPFPQNESSVHIWHGLEDRVVPVQLLRFISGKLPWIRYHEVPGGGHLIVHYTGLCEAVLRSLLLGEEPRTMNQVHP